ncbi:MAG: hypothetical protein WC501_02145 [Candidatus Micrarchaeia archaeon]
MNEINEAFSKTSKLIFGKEFFQIDDYGNWLLKRIPGGDLCQSKTSNKMIYFPGEYAVFKEIPKNRLADLESFINLGKIKIALDKTDDLAKISKKLEKSALFIVEFINGQNQNVVDSTIYQNLYNCYKILDCFDSKYLAYTFWVDNCEYVFGSAKSFDSKFSIHIYNSKKIIGSFEIDSCVNCSSSMFLHNCENTHDSIFCFNAKNLRYAVCNEILPKEKFFEIKKMLVEDMIRNLEKNHYLETDIYNLGLGDHQ